jgi:hypothetical protein
MSLPAGYTSRGDGTYSRTVTFVARRPEGIDRIAQETIVRDANGRLLRVERSNGAKAQRNRR